MSEQPQAKYPPADYPVDTCNENTEGREPSSPKLSPEDINAVIVKEQFMIIPGTTTTICCLTLVNGFNVIGKSACASHANFSKFEGEKYSRESAVGKVWELEGYLLHQRIHEAA